jgi:hypothetical protein
MLVNEYKLYVSIQKSSKDAKFGQCLYLSAPFVMSRTDAQNGLDMVFKFLVCYFRLYTYSNFTYSNITASYITN